MQLKLAPDLIIDTEDDRVKKQGLRIALVAGSGAGKSHAISLVAEQAKQQGLQVVFFDTHGEYWTFAEKFEDILVIGGDNADLPLEEAAVDVYAEAYRQGKSLDISFKEIFTDEEIYGKVAEKLLRALWKVQVNEPRPALFILEEGQILCPQEKNFDTVRRVSLVKNIATGGRKFGLSFILSTQRPAEIHKTPLSQCWIRLFGKITEAIDQKAVQSYLKPLKPEILGGLETGDFYVYGWFKTPELKKITAKRLTRHGGETLQLTPIVRKTGTVSSSIKDLKEQIEQLLDRKEEEKTELSSLKAQLTSKDKKIEELERKSDVAQIIRDSFKDRPSDNNVKGPVQKISPETMEKLAQLGTLETDLATTKEQLADARREISELQPYVELKLVMSKILGPSPVPLVDPEKPEWAITWLSKLKGPQKKILQFLVDNAGRDFTKNEIGVAIAMSSQGGAFKSAYRLLRINGLVRETGDRVRLK